METWLAIFALFVVLAMIFVCVNAEQIWRR